MNQRQSKKLKRAMLLRLLEICVSQLDENNHAYKAKALRIPSHELKKMDIINGYRLEIRPSREDKHNYAHFHVVKGEDGMASIRIDTLEVIESSLPKNDLKRILEWASIHREDLVKVWNEYHGYRILVELP